MNGDSATQIGTYSSLWLTPEEFGAALDRQSLRVGAARGETR
jgi:hypothetical protein